MTKQKSKNKLFVQDNWFKKKLEELKKKENKFFERNFMMKH